MSHFIILTSPSCSGKSHIEVQLKEKGYKSPVSYTTRQPRAGEVDGVDYFFLDRDEFERKIEAGDVLEYVEFSGNYYGLGLQSMKSAIKDIAETNTPYVVVIEPVGSAHVKKVLIEQKVRHAVVFIDVLPEVAESRFITRFNQKVESIVCQDKSIEIKKNMLKEIVEEYADRLSIMHAVEPHWKSMTYFDIYAEKSMDDNDADAIIDSIQAHMNNPSTLVLDSGEIQIPIPPEIKLTSIRRRFVGDLNRLASSQLSELNIDKSMEIADPSLS